MPDQARECGRFAVAERAKLCRRLAVLSPARLIPDDTRYFAMATFSP